MQERRDQGSDDERYTDGDSDAEGHAEVLHGEAITDIANAPHGAEESDFEQEVRTHGGIEAVKVGQQK